MKRLLTICCVALGIMLGFTACKSAKVFNDEVLVAKSKSQEMAESKPAIRAWGEAANFKQSFAVAYAEGQARNAFARKIEAIMYGGTEERNNGANQNHSNGEMSNGLGGTDQIFDNNAVIGQAIKALPLNNVVVINTDTYRMKDGQYHCYVCVEYSSSLEELAKEMTQSLRKTIGQQVSDRDRAKMEVYLKDYQDRVEKQLRDLR